MAVNPARAPGIEVGATGCTPPAPVAVKLRHYCDGADAVMVDVVRGRTCAMLKNVFSRLLAESMTAAALVNDPARRKPSESASLAGAIQADSNPMRWRFVASRPGHLLNAVKSRRRLLHGGESWLLLNLK